MCLQVFCCVPVVHRFEVPGGPNPNPTAGSLQENRWTCGRNGTSGHQCSCAWSVGFCTSLLSTTELILTCDVSFMQRSFQSVMGSYAGIHVVLTKGISNRGPFSARWPFPCLQIEWDSLLWKQFLEFSFGDFSDDRKEPVCLYRVY